MRDCRISLGASCYCTAETNTTAARKSQSAVLLLAHGSPDTAEEIPAFLQSITRGRPLPPQVVEEVIHRYSQIGFSPLTCWTRLQADRLSQLLDLPVYVGMRNWKPYISDAVKQIAVERRRHVVAICMAPQNSRTSVGLYNSAVVGDTALPFSLDFVESWHDQPLLARAFAEKFSEGWTKACSEAGSKVPVIFTAHSVPERTITEGDPYRHQSHQTAELVAQQAGLSSEEWVFAFQSQGMSGGTWIGPTVEETILGLKEKGHAGVFVQPIGFLCDHVEVLYDVDVAFHDFAQKHGMRLWRAASLNDSRTLTAALAEVARQRMAAMLSNSKSQ
jgi:protoporphyrin/coproporphyrin ferrochelatase